MLVYLKICYLTSQINYKEKGRNILTSHTNLYDTRLQNFNSLLINLIRPFRNSVLKLFFNFIRLQIGFRVRKFARKLLRTILISLIILLEIFLNSTIFMILVGFLLAVLVLGSLTSPFWIPLAFLWGPFWCLVFVLLKFTKVNFILLLIH